MIPSQRLREIVNTPCPGLLLAAHEPLREAVFREKHHSPCH